MITRILDKIKLILKLSISSIILISLVSLIYSFIVKGNIINNLFNFNYVLGSVILFYGILTLFVPINLKKNNRLVDHSNYGEVMKEEKEKKFGSIEESLLWGISHLVIIGLIEILVKSIA